MCEELSYQITNISVVNQAVFCYYCKNDSRNENISVSSSEKRRDALFLIHLRETYY